jgi:Helix-turn-helix domain
MFGLALVVKYCLGMIFIITRGSLQMSTETKERRPPLDTPAAADYLNVLPSYLERLRCTGDGPVFVKRNGLVRYDPDDLDAWFEGGKQRSTRLRKLPKPGVNTTTYRQSIQLEEPQRLANTMTTGT